MKAIFFVPFLTHESRHSVNSVANGSSIRHSSSFPFEKAAYGECPYLPKFSKELTPGAWFNNALLEYQEAVVARKVGGKTSEVDYVLPKQKPDYYSKSQTVNQLVQRSLFRLSSSLL